MTSGVVPELVRYEVHDKIATITLAHPPVNALLLNMTQRLADLADEVSRDDQVNAVVLYGEGRGFCAGLDIDEMLQFSSAAMAPVVPQIQDRFNRVAKIPKPVVAAVNGFALGGGLELAICADRRIASRSAVLGMPEVTLGLMPGTGGTQRLPRLIGLSAAKDLIFTGRHVSAQEAHQLGLVDEVTEDDRSCLRRAQEWAGQFRTLPIWSIRWSKEAIDTGLHDDLNSGLLLESTGFGALFGTEERRVRMQRFVSRHGRTSPPSR